jgi:hypothetical protein
MNIRHPWRMFISEFLLCKNSTKPASGLAWETAASMPRHPWRMFISEFALCANSTRPVKPGAR